MEWILGKYVLRLEQVREILILHDAYEFSHQWQFLAVRMLHVTAFKTF